MDDIFNALLKEAQFTCEMLCSGYTQIRNANFAKKGIYFQAFTSLSTGIERIGKISILLDYANNNDGFPDKQYMQKNIGHDIEKIYNICISLKEKYLFNFNYLQNLNDNIYKKILLTLSRFGKGDRYSNIDLLVNSRNYNDPISEWYNDVDMYIVRNNIKKYKIDKIMAQANFLNNFFSDISSVYFKDENNNSINTVYDMYLKNNINNLVGPFRQLYVYHVLRYFVELLLNLEEVIREKNIISIPYFSEIFQLINCPDDFPKNRKILVIR